MSHKESGESVALGCLLSLVMAPVNIILRGLVLRQLWYWFLVPLGVPAVGAAHALGISCLLGLFTMGLARDADKEETVLAKSIRSVTFGLLGPAVALGLGYLFSLFM